MRAGQELRLPRPVTGWWRPRSREVRDAVGKFLTPHTDPGGLGIIGKRLYLSEFGFALTAKVHSLPVSGGSLTTLLTGFEGEAFIGLGTNNGWVYVGEPTTAPGTGRVFRVKP